MSLSTRGEERLIRVSTPPVNGISVVKLNWFLFIGIVTSPAARLSFSHPVPLDKLLRLSANAHTVATCVVSTLKLALSVLIVVTTPKPPSKSKNSPSPTC